MVVGYGHPTSLCLCDCTPLFDLVAVRQAIRLTDCWAVEFKDEIAVWSVLGSLVAEVGIWAV